MVMKRARGPAESGTEATWKSEDHLSPFAHMVVWRLTKGMEARKKFGFPYMWSVIDSTGQCKSYGYCRNYKQACRKVSDMRDYILKNATVAFNGGDSLRQNLADITAD